MESSKRQIGECVFHVNHVSGLERQAAWLLSYFEKMQHDGISFFHGMKLQVGWSILELRKAADSYIVFEPDFSKNPLVDFRPDVSVTLQVQFSQVDLINRLNLVPTETSFQDKIIFAKGSLDEGKIYLERVSPRPEKGDSGWFIGFVNGNNDPSNLQSGFVYQLLYLRPILLQFLLLPAGSMVVLDGSKVEAILDHDGNPLPIRP